MKLFKRIEKIAKYYTNENCPVCGSKGVYTSAVKEKNGISIHHEQKYCPICEKYFYTDIEYVEHSDKKEEISPRIVYGSTQSDMETKEIETDKRYYVEPQRNVVDACYLPVKKKENVLISFLVDILLNLWDFTPLRVLIVVMGMWGIFFITWPIVESILLGALEIIETQLPPVP